MSSKCEMNEPLSRNSYKHKSREALKRTLDGKEDDEGGKAEQHFFNDASKLLHAYKEHVANARESCFPSKKKPRREEDTKFGVSYSAPYTL